MQNTDPGGAIEPVKGITMDLILLKISLWLVGIYIARRVLYVLWVRQRARANDVELKFIFDRERETGLQALSVQIPIYDEHSIFSAGIGKRGIAVGFTPQGELPFRISQFFSEYWLLQVMIDDQVAPTREQIYTMGIRAHQNGIRENSGILVYPPEMLAKGALAHTIMPGVDLFIICRDVTAEKIENLVRLGEVASRHDFATLLQVANEEFGAIGCLVNDSENWILQSEDARLMVRFAEHVLVIGCDHLFVVNGLGKPGGFNAGSVIALPQGQPTFKGEVMDCTMYFEDRYLAALWKVGKRTRVHSAILPAPVPGSQAHTTWDRVRRFLLPEIVPDRAYTRANLLRFATQYFFAVFYMIGIAVGLGLLTQGADGKPGIFGMIALAFGGFGAVISGLLSATYFFRAVFSRKKLIRSGI